MIEVCSPPAIEPEPGSGYQLCFWVLDPFNFDTPFRAMLDEIVTALGLDPDKHLSLPAFAEGEDFVEGTMLFQEASLTVYFEHARSYLSIASRDRAVLADILQRVSSKICVANAAGTSSETGARAQSAM